jgi:hypothetical protein
LSGANDNAAVGDDVAGSAKAKRLIIDIARVIIVAGEWKGLCWLSGLVSLEDAEDLAFCVRVEPHLIYKAQPP